MPTQLPVWLGFIGLTETPDSPRFSSDTTKTRIVRTYEGPYEAALSGCPSIGNNFSDLPGTVEVVEVELTKSPGGKGRLVVALETPFQTSFETEWVEVDRQLILNPRYWDGSTPDLNPAGAKPLTQQDKSMIEKWEAEENFLLKQAFLFKVALDPNNGTGVNYGVPIAGPLTIGGVTYTSPTTIAGVQYNVYGLSPQAQDYGTKRLKGEESYRIYAPVIRQTSESIDPPDVNACGLIETPPQAANAPAGYQWQRSAQRVTRTGPYGKYRLQIEWQGAQQIDQDLYGGDPSNQAPNPDGSLSGPLPLSAGSGSLDSSY